MNSERMKSRKLWAFMGLSVLNAVLGSLGQNDLLDPINKIGAIYLGAQGIADLGQGIGVGINLKKG